MTNANATPTHPPATSSPDVKDSASALNDATPHPTTTPLPSKSPPDQGSNHDGKSEQAGRNTAEPSAPSATDSAASPTLRSGPPQQGAGDEDKPGNNTGSPAAVTDMSADEWKKKGNEAYAAGRYDEAIAHYSSGIELEPTNAALFSNRSAAFLKVEDFSKAKRDADMAIELDPRWPKGWYRKGMAQLEAQDYHGARETFLAGLDNCPGDENLQKGRSDAEKRIDVLDSVQGPSAAGSSAAHAADPSAGKSAAAGDDDYDDGPFPGTPEEEIQRIKNAPNHYAVLHVSPDAGPAQMKKNYHLLARMLHPDKCQLPGSAEAMTQVSLAYDTLTNVVKKTLYDQFMSQAEQAPEGEGQTYAEWEAKQQPVELPRWLSWLLGIKGCGWVIAIVMFVIMLPIALGLIVIFLVFWLIFLPYRLTLRWCFPERYARMKEEAERERAKAEEAAQDRAFAHV